VETQQHGSVRVANLTPEVMTGRRFGLSKEFLIPIEAERNVSDTDDCPRAFHLILTIVQREPWPGPDNAMIDTLKSIGI
jgi:hypothetical protein